MYYKEKLTKNLADLNTFETSMSLRDRVKLSKNLNPLSIYIYRIEKEGGAFLTLLLRIDPYLAGIPNIARGSMMSYANDVITQEII